MQCFDVDITASYTAIAVLLLSETSNPTSVIHAVRLQLPTVTIWSSCEQ